MSSDHLISEIRRAFANAEPPARSDIAPHGCCECAKLTTELQQYLPGDIPDAYLKSRFDFLPLLSPKAFRYFLPCVLEFTIRNPSTSLVEFGLYALYPPADESPNVQDLNTWWDERLASFTDEERAVVRKYLEHRRNSAEDEIEKQQIERALKGWV